ncbi:MAG: ABC transporter ATP-binding protein, partial [Erysipelotrichaceae bacterium]|nr:ABC transporter ATP-binding protein [Erysipelotrichaceae bacterium]
MSETKVMQQQAKRKGVWKDFFIMLKTVKMPWVLLIVYVVWQMIQTKIILTVPQVNGNFFAGDASVKSVTMFIGIELLVTVVCQISLYMNHVIRYQLNRNLRNELWGKILKVKPKYYDSVSPNTLLSRITSDSESMNEFLMDIVLGILSSVYTLVLTIYEII